MSEPPPLGRWSPPLDGDTVVVRLVCAPLRIWQRATEHHDELMREMALLALSPPREGHRLPSQLVELVRALGKEYGVATSRPDAERDNALAAGLDRLDLSYEVPRTAGPAAERLAGLLREAEEFCRQGGQLLTLAQPTEQAAFARWYFGEFITQTAGGDPTPWPGPWD